jgi:AcrR family transcriptional regulator
LLEIAAKIFAEEGYKETGIESILKQAGLTGPALYRHFASKQEILDIICVSEMRHALDLALKAQARTEIDSTERLKGLVAKRIDHIFSSHGYSSILAVSQRMHLSPGAREQVLAMQRQFREICGDMLREAQPWATENQIKIALFAAQNMLVYSVWRSRDRTMVPESSLKRILESVIWNTLFFAKPELSN